MSKMLLNPEIKVADNVKPEDILNNKNYSSIVVGSKRFFDALAAVTEVKEDEQIIGCSFSSSVINVFLDKKINNET